MSEIEDEKQGTLAEIAEARERLQITKTELGMADKGLADLEMEIQLSPAGFYALAKPKFLERLHSTTGYIFANSPDQQFFASGTSANVADTLLAWRETSWGVVEGPQAAGSTRTIQYSELVKEFAVKCLQRLNNEKDLKKMVDHMTDLLKNATHLVARIGKLYESYQTNAGIDVVALKFREVINSIRGELWQLMPSDKKCGVADNRQWIAIMNQFGNQDPSVKSTWERVLDKFEDFIKEYNTGLHKSAKIDVYALIERLYILVINVDHQVLASISAR